LKGPRDSSANEELFTLVENLYFFLTQTFTPSAMALSLASGGAQVGTALLVSWQDFLS